MDIKKLFSDFGASAEDVKSAMHRAHIANDLKKRIGKEIDLVKIIDSGDDFQKSNAFSIDISYDSFDKTLVLSFPDPNKYCTESVTGLLLMFVASVIKRCHDENDLGMFLSAALFELIEFDNSVSKKSDLINAYMNGELNADELMNFMFKE